MSQRRKGQARRVNMQNPQQNLQIVKPVAPTNQSLSAPHPRNINLEIHARKTSHGS